MSIPLALLLACVSVAVITAMHGLYALVTDQREARQHELARRIGSLERARLEGEALALAGRDPVATHLGAPGRWIEGLLRQAGGGTSVQALLLQVGLAGFGATLVLALVLRSPLALAGLVVGVVPLLAVLRAADKRARAITEQLPDALDLVGRSLQAGHGLGEALEACARETPPPLAQELGRTWEQHNLGLDFRQALGSLVARNPRSFDLRLFAGSVLLQRETGGNLVEIVDNIAATIRGRFTLEAKVGALTSEARFSALILGGLPLFVAVAVLGIRPGYLQPLLVDPFGRTMLVYAVLSYLIGAAVLRRMSRLRT
jgi:tight adherence protein B